MKFAQRDYVGKDVNIDKLEGLIEEFFREEHRRSDRGNVAFRVQ